MRKFASLGMMVVWLVAGPALLAQEMPPKVEPSKEHLWLKQLVGEWKGDFGNAVSTSRMLGELWMVSDVKARFDNVEMNAVMTLGYEPHKKKFVGTWIDSMTAYLWTYEGTLDAAGKTLTLNAEGPNPMLGGKLCKMRDVITIKDKDNFTVASSMLGDDGKWTQFMSVNYSRKK